MECKGAILHCGIWEAQDQSRRCIDRCVWILCEYLPVHYVCMTVLLHLCMFSDVGFLILKGMWWVNVLRCHHLFLCFFRHSYTILYGNFYILVLILPTEFLCASNAWHRTPTNPSHTPGHTEVPEPLGIQRWCHSDSYSIRGNTKFLFPMYKHAPMPPFCLGTVYICVLSHEASCILQNSGMFFYVVYGQRLEAKASIAS